MTLVLQPCGSLYLEEMRASVNIVVGDPTWMIEESKLKKEKSEEKWEGATEKLWKLPSWVVLVTEEDLLLQNKKVWPIRMSQSLIGLIGEELG